MSAGPSDAPVREPGTRSRSGNAMARTRAALLQSAADCLERYGVRRTTMVDVAARSGVAKATLYNHFRTKDDLLVALVESAVADLVANGVRTAASDGPAAALAEAATALAGSGPLRRTASEEPALLAPLLVPGEGRGWRSARDGVGAVLAAGRVEPVPADVELVLRWLVSHLTWPATREQAASGAGLLVQGLGRPRVAGPAPESAPAAPASSVRRPAAAGGAGVGWPG